MKIENLEYFVGKICTVFTVPISRDFKAENPQTFPQPVFHYFVGKVIEINSRGICIEQWNSDKKLRTFFFINHIVAISEEEILDPSNPKDLKLIEEYKQVNEKTMKKAAEHMEELKKKKQETEKDPYLDINSLSQFAK